MAITKLQPFNLDSTANYTFANVTATNANLGNAATANYFIGSGNNLSNIQGSNVTGAVSYATTANSVAVANVSGIGNIATVNLDGNASNILYGNGVFASAPSGATYGNSNVASFLASYGSNTITTTGNVSVGNIIGNGQALTGLAGANVTGAVAYATTANSVAGANVSGQVANALVAGTVYTAAQPNITSVGTLTDLAVSNSTTIGSAAYGAIAVANTTGFYTTWSTTQQAAAWTISFWVYIPTQSINYPRGLFYNGDAGSGQAVQVFFGWNGLSTYSLQLENRSGGAGSNFTKTLSGAVSQDTWHFVTVSYNGTNTIYLGLDGDVSAVTGSAISSVYPGLAFGKGTGTTGQFNTYGPQTYTDVELTLGTASYTSNFTPPTTHPTSAGKTVLLLAKTAPTYITNEVTGSNVSINGSPTYSSTNPIAPTGTLTVAVSANLGNLTTTNNLSVTTYVTSNLIPNANVTYNLGNSTNRWKDLWLSNSTLYFDTNSTVAAGTITNGNSNVSIPVANGNITFSSAGNANIVVITGTGANVTGTANVTGNIAGGGELNISGNSVIGGNLTVNGTLTYINSTTLSISDPIINLQTGANGAAPVSNTGKDVGTALNYYDTSAKIAWMGWDVSNAEVAFGSNVSISSEVVTFTSLANIRAGNAQLGNAATANYFVGNLYGTANLATYATTANAVAGANVSGEVGYAAVANSVAGSNVSGAVGLATYATTANAVAGANVSGAVAYATTANAVAGANVSGAVAYATTANSVAVANVSGIGNIATVNLDGNASNILYGNGVFASAPSGATYGNSNVASFLASYGSNTITTTGNVSVGNIIGNGQALTDITGANVTGAVAYATTANAVAGANVSGAVTYATTANAVAGANVSGAVAYATTANAVAGSNVSGAVAYATTANSVSGSNVSGQVSNALIAGTVYTAAQPNITSVGTLTSVDVTGNITSGNANLGNATTANYFIGNLYGTANLATYATTANAVAGANVSGQVSNALVAGTVYTAAQPNITSVGSLTGLTVSNATGVVDFTTTANVTLGAVGNLHISGGTSGYVLSTDGSGALSWVAQTGGGGGGSNIANGTSNVTIATSGGNVTTSVAGNANVLIVTGTGVNVSGTLNTGSGVITGNGSGLSAIAGGNVSGQVGNALVAGTVYTNAQPNITSVGTLTALTVGPNSSITMSGTSGYIKANSIQGLDSTAALYPYYGGVGGAVGIRTDLTVGTSGTGNLIANAGDAIFGDASTVIITGGTSGYVLQTDGAGNLSWVAQSGGGGGGSITVQDEGTNVVASASIINFTGSGVTASNVSGVATVNISGGGGGGGTTTIQEYTATASQTTFTVSGGYTVGSLIVFVNGIQMNNGDYTASSGTTFSLSEARNAGDIVRAIYNLSSPSLVVDAAKTFAVAMSIALGM